MSRVATRTGRRRTGEDDLWASRRRHPTARPVVLPRPSSTFVGLVAVLLALNLLGLVMVLSASSVSALDAHGSAWYVALRQSLFLGIGLVGCALVMRVDYHRWRPLAGPALLASGVLLGLVLLPGLGTTVNGATRWLGWGALTFQPAEVAKLTVLVFVADLLARRAAWMADARATLFPALVVLGAFGALLMAQPNLGTTIVLGAIVVAVLYVAGTPLLPLACLTAAGGVLATALAFAAPYRRARVLAFLDPWQDYERTGYQTIQSLVGLASGGITGTGLGQSRSKWGFLPYAHTDFIFAIIGEELGLIGALAVVGLVVAFCVLGVRAALTAPDRFGMLLAAGITSWFGVQAFVNIGAVIGILPVTGVPLPFVSYGGTSLTINLIAAGLLLNVARQGRRRGAEPSRGSRRLAATS